MGEFTSDSALIAVIHNCARCGGNHNDVQWKRLTRPIVDNDVVVGRIEWTHWLPCPTNGEPVLQAELPTDIASRYMGAQANPPEHS